MLLVLTGCSKASKKDSASPPPSISSVSSRPSSSSASATPTPSPTGPASLGGRCEDLLPVSAVDDALARPVIGQTAFILGIAEPNIGRLTYLNCRYGLAAKVKGKPAPVPLVEIGVSLYSSAAQATRRVQGTVEDYRTHGATQQNAAVGPNPAIILLGYGAPTILASAGPRTVAITVAAKLITSAPTSALVALAKLALDATAGYTGAPGAGASPTSSAATDTASPSDTAS